LVGQEVRITASETPRVDDKDAAYLWEYSGQAANAGATADPRVYSLIPKDTRPISVTAHLKEKLHRDELAVKGATFSARFYSISIANLGSAFGNSTTRPKVWRPGKGIVVLDKEIAADEDVGLRADVAPETAARPLRYTWTVGAGATLTGNSNARETRVQRADAGAIEAAVEVRDAKDVVLGTASIVVQVTVGAADVATGAAKAAELAKLTNEAAASWSNGDIDAACQQGKAATAIDPGFALTTTYCGGRDRILALSADADAALAKASADKSQIDKAQADLDQAKAINANAKPVADLERRIADSRNAATKVAELLASAAAAWRNGDAETALHDAQSALAQALTSVEAQQARRRYADASTALQTARGKARDSIDRKDYDGALAAIAEGKKVLANDRALLQLEQEATRDKQDAAQQGVDRQRRLQLLQAAVQACNEQNWRECKAQLEAMLDGADKAMKPEDAPALDQAHKLLAKANAALANTPTPVNPPTPSATQTSNAQCQQNEAAALAKQSSGDTMGAMTLHAQALTACPKYCSAMRNVALGMDSLGKKAEATQWAQLALQCDPNDGSIKAIAANHGIPTAAPTPIATPTPPQPTPSPTPTATLAPLKPTPSPSATLAPPKPIATPTLPAQTIDGTYKGQLTVTKSIWKLSADGYTFSVTMNFTVNQGRVAGEIEGRADCGPQVKLRYHCGTFSATIAGTTDSGGGLKASYNGFFNWRQDDGVARQRALSGDLAGQVGSGEGSGTFNLAEYNESYKEWGFRSSGTWLATSTAKPVAPPPTPTATPTPLQPTPTPTKTQAPNPPPLDSNANPGSAQQCEDSYTHAERQFLIYVGSKEATDAKAAIEAYKATALGPCRGRVDACNAEAQISRLYGYIGDGASADAALKQAHECSNAHKQ
jgi:tetratricopeptide (TPR) repeat protein